MPYIRTSEQTKSGTEARSGPERSLCACAVRSAFSSAIHSCFKALVRFRSFSCPAPQHKARARSIHRRRLWIHWPSAIKACSFFSTPLSFFFTFYLFPAHSLLRRVRVFGVFLRFCSLAEGFYVLPGFPFYRFSFLLSLLLLLLLMLKFNFSNSERRQRVDANFSRWRSPTSSAMTSQPEARAVLPALLTEVKSKEKINCGKNWEGTKGAGYSETNIRLPLPFAIIYRSCIA